MTDQAYSDNLRERFAARIKDPLRYIKEGIQLQREQNAMSKEEYNRQKQKYLDSQTVDKKVPIAAKVKAAMGIFGGTNKSKVPVTAKPAAKKVKQPKKATNPAPKKTKKATKS